MGVVIDVASHFILSLRVGIGPRPDVDEFRGLIDQASKRVRPHRILADAGYDSEPNHQFARDKLSLRTITPAKHGRPTDKPASGRYRRLMQLRFDRTRYRQRSQVETVMSMLKRRQGNFCRGKTEGSRNKELYLMVLTHNVMILWWA
ncbi:transposase [bacterium]|nr:transposase [bacterium]